MRRLRTITVRTADDPARRFKLLYNLFGFGIAGTFGIIGPGYAVAGGDAISSTTLHFVADIEHPIGGLHAHGVILMLLAAWLLYGLPSYRRVTRWALIAITFYSLMVATLIFEGWFYLKVSYGAPWWYVVTAYQSIVLLVLAPPLGESGHAYTGEDYEGGVGAT